MPTPTLPPLPEPQKLGIPRRYAALVQRYTDKCVEVALSAQAAEIERLTVENSHLMAALDALSSLATDKLVALTMPRLMHGCDALGAPADGEHCELLRRALIGFAEPQPPTARESPPLLDAFAIRNACPRGYNRCGWDAVAHQCVAEGCAPWQPQPITTKEPE